jgi:hypothetical protein
MCSNSGLPVNIGVAVLTTGNLPRYQDDPNVDQYIVGSVPGQPEPADVQDLENDPKLQQIAKSMGTSVRGLLQLRHADLVHALMNAKFSKASAEGAIHPVNGYLRKNLLYRGDR